MQYTYEFEVVKNDEWLTAVPFDMPGGTQGKDWEEVALMAAEWLKADIEHRLMHGVAIPKATFGNTPLAGGARVIVSTNASLDKVESVSAAKAARMLEVTPARITHMIRDGLLDAYKDGHNTFVTVASIEARLAEPRKAGRPKKEFAVK